MFSFTLIRISSPSLNIKNIVKITIKRFKEISAIFVQQASPSDLGDRLEECYRPFFSTLLGEGEEASQFSAIFSCFLAGCIRGELAISVGEVSCQLKDWTEDNLSLSYDFWKIRKKFAQEGVNTIAVQDELNTFFQEREEEIPEEGLLPDFLGMISNRFPNPDLTLQKEPRY